jgi:hypothetical protein
VSTRLFNHLPFYCSHLAWLLSWRHRHNLPQKVNLLLFSAGEPTSNTCSGQVFWFLFLT